MSKKSKEELQKSIEEKLTDDKLEDVSGGHIELDGGETMASAEKKIVTNGLTSNGRGHFA